MPDNEEKSLEYGDVYSGRHIHEHIMGGEHQPMVDNSESLRPKSDKEYGEYKAAPITVEDTKMQVNRVSAPTGEHLDVLTGKTYPSHEAFLNEMGKTNEFSTGGTEYKHRKEAATKYSHEHPGTTPRQAMTGTGVKAVYDVAQGEDKNMVGPPSARFVGKTGSMPSTKGETSFDMAHGDVSQQSDAEEQMKRLAKPTKDY